MLAVLILAVSAHAAAIDLERTSSQDFFTLLHDAAPPPPARPAPTSNELIFEKNGALITPGLLALKLSVVRVVYAGEQHDQDSHHQVQLKVLKSLRALKPGLVVGLEMISQDLQKDLDDYLSGKMPDAEFEQFWKKAWGFPYPLYRPILEFCRARHIRVVGLNAPIAVVRQIAKGGLSSLTPAQRRWLPATIAQTGDAKYMAYLEKSLEGHGPMPPIQKARMLDAMAAWNETMGAKVAELSARHPVLALAGSGHMVYGKGIAESASRRARLLQDVVLPYPLDSERTPLADLLKILRDPKSGDAQLADHFWLLPKD